MRSLRAYRTASEDSLAEAAGRILIVDDDWSVAEALQALLAGAGYLVRTAPSAEGALGVLRGEVIDLVLLDLRLGRQSGLDLLPALRELSPGLSVIVISAAASIEAAVESMRRGADNFVSKPVDPPRLLAFVEKGLQVLELRRHNLALVALLQERTEELAEARRRLALLSAG